MSMWSIAPVNGPVTGPLIGGFVFQYLGWRWDNWIVMIIAGFALAALLTLKETYAPAILQRKAARMRKETDDPRWWCRYDQRISKLQLLKINLSRPFVLSLTEPILWFFNVWYVAVVEGSPCLLTRSWQDFLDLRYTLPLLRRVSHRILAASGLGPGFFRPCLHGNRHRNSYGHLRRAAPSQNDQLATARPGNRTNLT
jgi:MFS family permease